MEYIEAVVSSARAQMELENIGLYREMISDAA
jgi:hypothetical protein